MKRDGALRILAANREKLGGFSVKSIALFGSVARDEAVPGSDIDLLVGSRPRGRVGLTIGPAEPEGE